MNGLAARSIICRPLEKSQASDEPNDTSNHPKDVDIGNVSMMICHGDRAFAGYCRRTRLTALCSSDFVDCRSAENATKG